MQYNEHTNNYFIELNTVTVFNLLKYKAGLFRYKVNKNLLPIDIKNSFVHKYGQVHTRKTMNFQQFDVRTTKKQMFISMRISILVKFA